MIDQNSNVPSPKPTGWLYKAYDTPGAHGWRLPKAANRLIRVLLGSGGGNGSVMVLDLLVKQRELLWFYVGGYPRSVPGGPVGGTPQAGGFNGGGSGYSYNSNSNAGAGATDLRRDGSSIEHRVAVVGGQGGGGWNIGAGYADGGPFDQPYPGPLTLFREPAEDLTGVEPASHEGAVYIPEEYEDWDVVQGVVDGGVHTGAPGSGGVGDFGLSGFGFVGRGAGGGGWTGGHSSVVLKDPDPGFPPRPGYDRIVGGIGNPGSNYCKYDHVPFHPELGAQPRELAWGRDHPYGSAGHIALIRYTYDGGSGTPGWYVGTIGPPVN